MKLFALVLAAIQALPSNLPGEVHVCEANQLEYGGNVNGRYTKKTENGQSGRS